MAKTKTRRSAVDDVLGDDSPFLRTLAKEVTRPKPQQSPESEPEAQTQAEQPTQEVNLRSSKLARPHRPNTSARRAISAKRPVANGKAKRLLVSIEEEQTMDELASKLGMAVGTKVQFSQVTRAMWALLLDVEEVMDGVRAPSLKRPSNGNTADLAEFESELSAYLLDLFHAVKQGPR
jgi:hypothetical protein